MGEITKIQWCHHTFNAWRGCTKVHLGCTRCYAEKLVTGRLGGAWGKGATRVVAAESTWKLPMRWARAAAKAGERRRVFCASLADVLDEEAPKQARHRLWQLIRDTAHLAHRWGESELAPSTMSYGGLDWLILTKRPESWELVPEDVRPLVWLGTSISDQATADEWVPRLLRAEGFRLRFLSIEPQVGPVEDLFSVDGKIAKAMGPRSLAWPADLIRWVIVGGESGPGARPFELEWARSIVRQCADAQVACFVKQLGGAAVDAVNGIAGAGLKVNPDAEALVSRRLADSKGGDWSEWPEDLRVRQFPEVARAA